MTTESTTYEQALPIPKFCPVCGLILNRVYDEQLECDCWVCPDTEGCGYIEPILP